MIRFVSMCSFCAFLAVIYPISIATADTVTLVNGCQYEGELGPPLTEINERASGGGNVDTRPILFLDDGLRRTYFPRTQLAINPTPNKPIHERIMVDQRVAHGRRAVGEVGQLLYIGQFDEFGRRAVGVNSARGPIDLYQGITEITPLYCVVEGVESRLDDFEWRLRVATASIPRQTLSRIIYRQIDPTNSNDRLSVVRLYLQAERYKDAVSELETIVADFPELTSLNDTIDSLRSTYARRVFDEIQLRYNAGQENLALGMIQRFPTENIASEVLGEVRTFSENNSRQLEQIESIKEMIGVRVDEVVGTGAWSEEQVTTLRDIQSEIVTDLNLHNVSRMASFYRLFDDGTKTPDQIVAFAVAGWLMGSESGDGNLAVALEQVNVRNLVYEYLSTADLVRRQVILRELEEMEGSQPADLAKIVNHLLPVKFTQQENHQGIPGFYKFELPGVEEDHLIEYVAQLPPEYDPYRRYPCIVTLGDAQTPEQQVEWWAGQYDLRNGMRMGQASRNGYIVISPKWREDDELVYRYTAKEHATVLFSLHDAVRRFSIDTDKVFLSGHSQGGSAAWDIGVSHPDLWAGVIPIVATAGQYVSLYHQNVRYNTPFYFVHGEYDHRRMDANSRDWNRYFRPGYDMTLTEYRGRGHEDYYEDILRMFDWMNLHERDFFPKEFDCVRLRPTDRFFWWVEARNFRPDTVVLPAEFDMKDKRVGDFIGEINETTTGQNRIVIKTASANVTLWLTPELVDFSRDFTLNINNNQVRGEEIRPDRVVLLEDVRTRGDRQHPFWAKYEWSGRNR